jgi:hypothetical protein
MYLYEYAYVDGQTRWVAQTLSGITSTHIEQVSFRFGTTAIVHEFLRWRVIDEVMARSTFCRLKRVDILPSGLTTPDVVAWYAAGLPRCQNRSILSVHTVEWKPTVF